MRSFPEGRSPVMDDSLTAPTARPILVTGSHRSGSTWVGHVLALAEGTGYIHEPFNRNTSLGICRARFPVNFTYVTEANEEPYLDGLRDTLAWRYDLASALPTMRRPIDTARIVRDFIYFESKRRRRARSIMKDPIALFSAEWLARRFDMQVVVVVRRPAAFVASVIAAGWHRYPFRQLLNQSALMENCLAPLRAEIEAAVAKPPDPVQASTLLWQITHHHIEALRQRHPDWIFVRHEDLVQDPETGFRAIYGPLGLAFTPEVEVGIRAFSAPKASRRLPALFRNRVRVSRNSKEAASLFRRRLSQEEVRRIEHATRPIAERFYPTPGPA